VKSWREYRAISALYGDQVARRSGVPLMNHVDEGLELLRGWSASDLTMRAYCLHPIVQSDEPIDVSWSPAYPLACEYRDRANAYLCRPETDGVTTLAQVRALVGESMSRGCGLMLLADKTQNLRDFERHHGTTHPRREQLRAYFALWLRYLHGLGLPFPTTGKTLLVTECYGARTHVVDGSYVPTDRFVTLTIGGTAYPCRSRLVSGSYQDHGHTYGYSTRELQVLVPGLEVWVGVDAELAKRVTAVGMAP